MRARMRVIAPFSVLAVALSLTACSASTPSAVVTDDAEVDVNDGLVIDGETIADAETYEAAKEQTITLYTGYQEANQIAFNEAFTADTGIKVEYVRDVTNKLSERILSEAGANQLGADVIITSDYKVAHEFAEEGILEAYSPSTLDADSDLILDDGDFTTFANVVVTFAYNTQKVAAEDAPKAWADLTDPKYAGAIGITSGTAGGSSIALNRFLQEEVDPDFWTKIAALDANIYDSGGQRQEALARGELSVATAGTASVNVAVTQDGAPIEYVVPEEGLVLFSFFIGKVAETENAEAAEVFMNYALSQRGQSVVSQVGDYGSRADVDPPVANGRELPSLDSDQVWIMAPEDEVTFGADDAQIWKDAFNR